LWIGRLWIYGFIALSIAIALLSRLSEGSAKGTLEMVDKWQQEETLPHFLIFQST